LIRKQELDRHCHEIRLGREAKDSLQNQLNQKLEAARHQYRVKSAMVREEAKSLEREMALAKKEELRLGEIKRRERKEAKKQELRRVE
jgi:hypothetical protein